MSWFYLLSAGLLEVVWEIGLTYTGGFNRVLPGAIAAMVASVWFLALA